jgi:hypothetical protein
MISDQNAAVIIQQHLAKLGVYFHGCNFSPHTRAQIFGNMKLSPIRISPIYAIGLSFAANFGSLAGSAVII